MGKGIATQGLTMTKIDTWYVLVDGTHADPQSSRAGTESSADGVESRFATTACR